MIILLLHTYLLDQLEEPLPRIFFLGGEQGVQDRDSASVFERFHSVGRVDQSLPLDHQHDELKDEDEIRCQSRKMPTCENFPSLYPFLLWSAHSLKVPSARIVWTR